MWAHTWWLGNKLRWLTSNVLQKYISSLLEGYNFLSAAQRVVFRRWSLRRVMCKSTINLQLLLYICPCGFFFCIQSVKTANSKLPFVESPDWILFIRPSFSRFHWWICNRRNAASLSTVRSGIFIVGWSANCLRLWKSPFGKMSVQLGNPGKLTMELEKGPLGKTTNFGVPCQQKTQVFRSTLMYFLQPQPLVRV